jgi:predicted HAD superfamily Cof-like phosphohydrolase
VSPFFYLCYMEKQLKAVEEFHTAFGQANGQWPSLISNADYNLRHSLMKEENDEYLEACYEKDLVEIADALGDQLYILCGTILKHGMQHIIEDVFNEIQASNMSKLNADGKPIIRHDGKILKGENYFAPNLEQFFKLKKDAPSNI